MHFQQFCFGQQQSSWSKPSPSHESTLIQSNQQRQISSDANSDQESIHSKTPHATKLIRKKYDPIRDGDRIIRFQDNPSEYRKARKKIQNRLSATRVRGKKKTHMEELQQEATTLRQRNSELQLFNAKIQAENNMLRQRVNFLQKVILSKNINQADSYINVEPAATTASQKTPSEGSSYESPFIDFDNQSVWSRVSSPGNMSREWIAFTVLTIVLSIFIIPSDAPQQTAMIAAKISELQLSDRNLFNMMNSLYSKTLQLDWIKWYCKAIFILVYLCFLGYIFLKRRDLQRLRKLKRF